MKIMLFQYIKVNFELVINWRITTDILQANPNFHSHPHYNYVLIQMETGSCLFAKLCYIFQMELDKSAYNMALILPMDIPIIRKENDSRQSAHDLHLKWIQAHLSANTVIIPIDCILRGALLVEGGSQYLDEYIVMDVIDVDM